MHTFTVLKRKKNNLKFCKESFALIAAVYDNVLIFIIANNRMIKNRPFCNFDIFAFEISFQYTERHFKSSPFWTRNRLGYNSLMHMCNKKLGTLESSQIIKRERNGEVNYYSQIYVWSFWKSLKGFNLLIGVKRGHIFCKCCTET